MADSDQKTPPPPPTKEESFKAIHWVGRTDDNSKVETATKKSKSVASYCNG